MTDWLHDLEILASFNGYMCHAEVAQHVVFLKAELQIACARMCGLMLESRISLDHCPMAHILDLVDQHVCFHNIVTVRKTILLTH